VGSTRVELELSGSFQDAIDSSSDNRHTFYFNKNTTMGKVGDSDQRTAWKLFVWKKTLPGCHWRWRTENSLASTAPALDTMTRNAGMRASY
jgi:hypothetical protein